MKSGDGILLVMLILATVAMLFWGNRESPAGEFRISVSRFPERTVRVPLTGAAAHLSVQGWIGNATVAFDPQKGMCFQHSPCPNQVCVGAGWVRPPFGVVCVPNGVIVAFETQRPSGVDGVTQ
jgi:hypothetical protein